MGMDLSYLSWPIMNNKKGLDMSMHKSLLILIQIDMSLFEPMRMLLLISPSQKINLKVELRKIDRFDRFIQLSIYLLVNMLK